MKRNSFMLAGCRWLVLAFALGSITYSAWTASPFPKFKTRNVILVTLDGLRWQELFGGADPALLNKEHGGVRNVEALRNEFWRESEIERREALMPFMWKVIGRQGQLLGNTNRNSVVKVTNGLKFSYPGYSEMLTGAPDPRIDSNAKQPNPNVNVLEWLQARPACRGRIAAFCAWDVFPCILNRDRNGLHLRAGWEVIDPATHDPAARMLNELARDTTPEWEGEIHDSFIFQAARLHLQQRKPRVLYVAFGETDEWAHAGRYDRLLQSAHRTDEWIRLLWEAAQAMPSHRGKTTLFIATDHGRGGGLKEWKNHGKDVEGAEYIWLAALGPDTPALGERADTTPLTQSQVAATVAAFLGEDYCAAMPAAAKPVRTLFAP